MLKRILQLIVVLLIATQGVMAQTVQIESVTKPPGEILVPVNMTGFTNVAAITFEISYDANLMEYVGIDNTQIPGSWTSNANDGKIMIAYTSSQAGTGYDINGKAFDLKFNYKGGFSGDLNFNEQNCEIAKADLTQVTGVTYTGGTVSQTAAVGNVAMTNQTADIGSTVTVPVDFSGSGFGSVSSFTLLINFDDDQLDFSGLNEKAVTGITVNVNNGVLKIQWNGASMNFTSLTNVLDVKFVYNGVGNAAVNFVGGCEINDNNLVPLAVDYTSCEVAPNPSNRKLKIATVSSNADTIVEVPVSVENITETVGAITMVINYDNSKLSYRSYVANQLTGWTVNNSNSGQLVFQWSNNNGAVLSNGDLVTLKFDYDSLDANISFGGGTGIYDVNLNLLGTTFENGKVTQGGTTPPAGYTVSGQLTYMGDAAKPIGTSGSSVTTVYLKNVSDNSIAYTTSTDANGNYTFSNVASGNYFLDASTTIDAKWAYDQTDAFVINGIGNTLTGIQALAADVNADNTVDMQDAFIVFGSVNAGNVKVAAWVAADWFFDNKPVSVSGSDVAISFSGIASGDANGDWVPVP